MSISLEEDVRKNTSAPKRIPGERAAALREFAHQAVHGSPPEGLAF